MENTNIDINDWNETVNIAKKIDEERIRKCANSMVYKIPLYSFKTNERNYYLCDDEFDEKIKLESYIYVNIIDERFVKEIITGFVYPIIDLEKNCSDWISAFVRYNAYTEEVGLFTLSYNRILMTKRIKMDELEEYLSVDRQVAMDNLKSKKLIK